MADEIIDANGIAALTALVLDLYVHVMALGKLQARSVPADKMLAEVNAAREALDRIPQVRDFRTNMSSERLAGLDRALRDVLIKNVRG